jgi:hypothetical protein
MTDQQTSSFDTFTGSESDRMEAIIAELDGVPWAQGILQGVQRDGGLVGKNMARFFELRFGHALYEAGIGVEYEVPGEDESTLDFGFTSKGQAWKVEMMRLLETQAAKAAAKTGIDENGVRWTRRLLSSGNVDKRQSTEGETLQVIQRICQKCEDGGKPRKFPKPETAFHAILVDMRTFKDGGDVHDRLHIGLGGEYVKAPYRAYWEKKLISGVFGRQTVCKGAAEARDCVHFIGFIRERSFRSGELGMITQFVANPHLLKNGAAVKATIDTWPLQPMQVLNGGYRRQFGRDLPIERDMVWPDLWHVILPKGDYSDMVNLTRAKDAAHVLALALLYRVGSVAA